jgi:hypothetical protein
MPISAWPALLAFAAAMASCTDPVLDDKVNALGGEVDGVSQGPDHRPGQPCVVCHGPGGPASDDPFALAGTVYEGATSKQGAEGVELLLVDSLGSNPFRENNGLRAPILTTKSGNFFVRTSEWQNLRFPVLAGITRGVYRKMQSHIGREPSCSACHHDPDPSVFGDRLSAVGHIYLQ